MNIRSTSSKAWEYSSFVYAFAIVAAVIMIILSYKTSRSLGEVRSGPIGFLLIRMSVTIPELVIWAIALRAAVRFKQYVAGIKRSDDGSRLDYIANGLLFLVAYIITLTMGSLVVQTAHDWSRLNFVIALNNYLPLFIALLSSCYLYVGSRRLANLAGSSGRNRRRELRYVLPFMAFVALFVVNFYTNASGSVGGNGVQRFAFSINVLMVSYVFPYIIMWSLGLLACVNLAWYSHNAPGTLYKRLFRNFYQGILIIMISLFSAQVLTIIPLTLETVNFGLVVIYGVLMLAVGGFALIYRGTQKLEKLEVVT